MSPPGRLRTLALVSKETEVRATTPSEPAHPSSSHPHDDAPQIGLST
jgi:hypothetical protein